MAISLSAKQKNITNIFKDKDQYIIPPYQRPYSWRYDHCNELFDDLVDAYDKHKKDKAFGYFIGNIVLAYGQDKRDKYEVIDGQQRLTTLTLLLKAMYSYDSRNIKLKNSIWILNDRTEDIIEQRLITNIFIEKDYLSLEKVLEIGYSFDYVVPKKDIDLFQQNICLFHNRLKELVDSEQIHNFIDFFLYEVSLLPIQIDDTEAEKASDKALNIFETMNDRGLSLSNSDIFKSTLYDMAHKKKEVDTFINMWQKLELTCEDLDYSIDRIFKIYTYQVRGHHGIQSSEIGLREFFKQTKESPFRNKSYDSIMNDLFDITDAIEFFDETRKLKGSELAKWFQLIYEYTNNFPKDTMFTYLAKNNPLIEDKSLLVFTKSLVRYCYFQGSTTTIKTFIYKLMTQIMHDNWKEYFPTKDSHHSFRYSGRLYKGYSLLTSYLNKNQKSVYPYYIRRLRDNVNTHNLIEDYWSYDCIGNAIAIDHAKSKIIDIESSKFIDLSSLQKNIPSWNDTLHKKRQDELIGRLEEFFEVKNED